MFYDNFLRLCNQKNTTPTRAVTEMGFQKSVATRWKKSIPTDANKIKIAEYFGISVDELMSNGTHQKEKPATENGGEFTEKDKRDITKDLEKMMADLERDSDLIFDGAPASPEALSSISTALAIGLEYAKRVNKEKYTPKKYSKK